MRTSTSLLVLVACGPSVGVPQDAGGGTTSSTSGSDSATSDEPVPLPTTATTVGPSTTPPDPVTTFATETAGSTSTSGTEDSSTGEYTCGPTDDVAAMVRLDNGGSSGSSTLDCTVGGVQWGVQNHQIELLCGGVTHRLRVTTPSDPWVPMGSEVVLHVHFTGSGFSNDLVVALTTTGGGLILAGSTSAGFAGDGLVDADFFGSLSVAVNADMCEVERLPGTDFTGPCYVHQRESITFGLHGDEVTVLDHNREPLAGNYEAVVEIAERRLDNTCDDTEHWYQWVVYEPMPG